jgi:hypothetical protein
MNVFAVYLLEKIIDPTPLLEIKDDLAKWYGIKLRPYREYMENIHLLEPDGISSGLVFYFISVLYLTKTKDKHYAFLFSLLYMLVDHTIDNGTKEDDMKRLIKNGNTDDPLLKDIYTIFVEMIKMVPSNIQSLYACFKAETDHDSDVLYQSLNKGASILNVVTDEKEKVGSAIQLVDDLLDYNADREKGRPTYITSIQSSWEYAMGFVMEMDQHEPILPFLNLCMLHVYQLYSDQFDFLIEEENVLEKDVLVSLQYTIMEAIQDTSIVSERNWDDFEFTF